LIRGERDDTVGERARLLVDEQRSEEHVRLRLQHALLTQGRLLHISLIVKATRRTAHRLVPMMAKSTVARTRSIVAMSVTNVSTITKSYTSAASSSP